MLSDHNNCIEKGVKATSESEKEDALRTTREYIEWCLKEKKYFHITCLLQSLHDNMENIAPEILLGAFHYTEKASDHILDWQMLLDNVAAKCGVKSTLTIPTCHKTSEWVLIYQGCIVHFTRSDIRWDSSPKGPGGTDQLEAYCTDEDKTSIREDEWPKDLEEWSMVTATKYLLEKLFPPRKPLDISSPPKG